MICGSRRAREDVACRASCRVQRTVVRIIQQCFRIHEERIIQHNDDFHIGREVPVRWI